MSAVVVAVDIVAVNLVDVAFSGFVVTVKALASKVSIRSRTVVTDVC